MTAYITPDHMAKVRHEIHKAIIGCDDVVSGLLVAMLADGHVLLEGVPGTAKTLLVRTLSAACSLESSRVQFTPDLMPGDITGSLVYDSKASDFEFRPGPIFANIVLADEINRTPPKTQSALLEAMEERQVSVDGKKYPLPEVFMVAATQNPVEQEGTYPLPEAQLDRFLVKLNVGFAERDEEIAMVMNHATGFNPTDLDSVGVQPVLDSRTLRAAITACSSVRVDQNVATYIVDICRATRVSASVALGVSPRGATALLRTARVWAWLSGRDYVLPDDVKLLAPITLAHRIKLHAEAELDELKADDVLRGVLVNTAVPK